MKPVIIICEDDKMLQNFYSIILEKVGYKALIYENGNDILDALTKVSVKLIIMDINLKNTYIDGVKTNGIELTKRIKMSEKHNNIPILLATAFTPKEKNNNFLEKCKADSIIYKPIVDFNKFLGTVNSLIENGEK